MSEPTPHAPRLDPRLPVPEAGECSYTEFNNLALLVARDPSIRQVLGQLMAAQKRIDYRGDNADDPKNNPHQESSSWEWAATLAAAIRYVRDHPEAPPLVPGSEYSPQALQTMIDGGQKTYEKIRAYTGR